MPLAVAFGSGFVGIYAEVDEEYIVCSHAAVFPLEVCFGVHVK